MRIGFSLPHVGAGSSTAAIDRVCEVAETYGADTVWAVDHIAFPYGFQATYPYGTHQFGDPQDPTEWWDCLSVLAYAAARTERVRLGTGVTVLPYRHPVATAKAIATVDALSSGRVLFGVGVGWLRDEFEALELIDFDSRGEVTNEQLRIIKAVWSQKRTAFQGRFYSIPELSVTPRPVQQPGPPVLVGGNSAAALRRAVQYGDGWHGLMLLPDEMAERRATLRKLAQVQGRTAPLPVSLLIGTRIVEDSSVYGTLGAPDRRAAMTGTPTQIISQLMAYEEAGVDEIQTTVRLNGAPQADPATAIEMYLREIWAGFLSASGTHRQCEPKWQPSDTKGESHSRV
jgi:probable F420-dependent oxidoreductase